MYVLYMCVHACTSPDVCVSWCTCGGQGKPLRIRASPLTVGSENRTQVLRLAQQVCFTCWAVLLAEEMMLYTVWLWYVFNAYFSPRILYWSFWSIKSQVWKTKVIFTVGCMGLSGDSRGWHLWAPGQPELHREFWVTQANASKGTKIFHMCPLWTFSLLVNK